jgi:hypothetical protein
MRGKALEWSEAVGSGPYPVEKAGKGSDLGAQEGEMLEKAPGWWILSWVGWSVGFGGAFPLLPTSRRGRALPGQTGRTLTFV